MITLFLLHPLKQIPVQVWTFVENEPVIRIGRSTDNHVILYSAVVSRHHVELRRDGLAWEIVNLGTNGTYLDGKRIAQVPLKDGAIIRLARSGPNIQVHFGTDALKNLPESMKGDRTISQRADQPHTETEIAGRTPLVPAPIPEGNAGGADQPEKSEGKGQALSPPGTIPVPSHLQISSDNAPNASGSRSGLAVANRLTQAIAPSDLAPAGAAGASSCLHRRQGPHFCLDCGQPLNPLWTIGPYRVIKVLGQGKVGITYLAWSSGQQLVLKTLNNSWVGQSQAHAAFDCEAEILRQLHYSGLPQFVDFFSQAGRPYLVMELIAGQSLAQRITDQGPISLPQAVNWILQICDVLTYLHRFRPPVLHRDIQPHSLICCSQPHSGNQIGLVDFGAIKALVLDQSPPPRSHAYVAPEQLEIDATPSSDLYALGPLLAYCITGQDPVLFYQDQAEGPRFSADLVPGLPSTLKSVLAQLTHSQVEARYSSAAELADDLRSIQCLGGSTG